MATTKFLGYSIPTLKVNRINFGTMAKRDAQLQAFENDKVELIAIQIRKALKCRDNGRQSVNVYGLDLADKDVLKAVSKLEGNYGVTPFDATDTNEAGITITPPKGIINEPKKK